MRSSLIFAMRQNTVSCDSRSASRSNAPCATCASGVDTATGCQNAGSPPTPGMNTTFISHLRVRSRDGSPPYTLRSKHRQLPGVGLFIVANEIDVAVCALHFEVPVVGRQPCVEYI